MVSKPSSGHWPAKSTWEQAFGEKDMATFDTLIDDLAGVSGLASTPGRWSKVLTMISTSQEAWAVSR
jgi:hypothetical protein